MIYSDPSLSPIPELKNLHTRLPKYLIGFKTFLHTLLYSNRVSDSSSDSEKIAIPSLIRFDFVTGLSKERFTSIAFSCDEQIYVSVLWEFEEPFL